MKLILKNMLVGQRQSNYIEAASSSMNHLYLRTPRTQIGSGFFFFSFFQLLSERREYSFFRSVDPNHTMGQNMKLVQSHWPTLIFIEKQSSSYNCEPSMVLFINTNKCFSHLNINQAKT